MTNRKKAFYIIAIVFQSLLTLMRTALCAVEIYFGTDAFSIECIEMSVGFVWCGLVLAGEIILLADNDTKLASADSCGFMIGMTGISYMAFGIVDIFVGNATGFFFAFFGLLVGLFGAYEQERKEEPEERVEDWDDIHEAIVDIRCHK